VFPTVFSKSKRKIGKLDKMKYKEEVLVLAFTRHHEKSYVKTLNPADLPVTSTPKKKEEENSCLHHRKKAIV